MKGGTVRSRCDRREVADRRKILKLACTSSIGTSALTSSAGSPLPASCKKSRWNCYFSNGYSHDRHSLSDHREFCVIHATRCSSVRCSGPTPSASRACDFLRFSKMPSTPRRSCSHSVAFPIAAISRESSGGRMTVMSSINETALAPDAGGLALNYFWIFSEPAL